MAKLIVLYNQPADPAAFDSHYQSVHVPLAKRIPGLDKFTINAGTIMTPAGPSPYHAVAVLAFASMNALQAGLASTEGQAAAADVATFASGGASMLFFDEKSP